MNYTKIAISIFLSILLLVFIVMAIIDSITASQDKLIEDALRTYTFDEQPQDDLISLGIPGLPQLNEHINIGNKGVLLGLISILKNLEDYKSIYNDYDISYFDTETYNIKFQELFLKSTKLDDEVDVLTQEFLTSLDGDANLPSYTTMSNNRKQKISNMIYSQIYEKLLSNALDTIRKSVAHSSMLSILTSIGQQNNGQQNNGQ